MVPPAMVAAISDPQPVAVGEQAHRHGPEQRDARCEGDDDGNDGDGGAQGRHHGGMREFARLKWPGTPKRARLTRCHLTILPVPDQHSVRAAVTVTTERPFDLHSISM